MDRQIIAAGIADRRQQVTFIEDRLVFACERAAGQAHRHGRRRPAGHGRRGRRPPEDRDAWDRHTWNRYLREAVAQEHEFGPELRRLHGEIAVLERLSSLPLAA